MPTYDYACQYCGKEEEIFHYMNQQPDLHCAVCDRDGLKKMISQGAGIIFKGSGFYETDYKKKAPSEKSEIPQPTACSKDACSC